MKFYNSLSRKLEDFQPSDKNEVRFYSCGPTVYNNVHIGNLRAYIFADTLKRVLTFNGYNVNWVMNITDIEDKIISSTIKEFGPKANVEDLKNFTQKYVETFSEDLAKVNINDNDISFVKVTEKVADIQEYIIKLMEKGFAYKADDGSTYFSIEKYQKEFGDYGALVGPKFIEGKRIGARVKVDEYDKENLSDFALWKAHAEDDAEIFWDHSVLGKGRPGWHIECTLVNYLKFPTGTDIHSGGVDLKFPHHTNEIAQAQPIYKPFVRYWLHSEHIQVNDTKMSKSLGNVYVLKDLEAEGISDGLALRYLYLQSHYRSKVNVTHDSLKAAKNGFENISKQIGALKMRLNDFDPNVGTANEKFIQRFEQAINDDLNTPEALAIFHELLASNLDDGQKLQTAYKMDEVFGLDLENVQAGAKALSDIPGEINELIEKRNEAKKVKDYVLSDQIRKEIEQRGYKIIDTAQGTEVYKN
jgi:cysteinyl-tRNA synthetase